MKGSMPELTAFDVGGGFDILEDCGRENLAVLTMSKFLFWYKFICDFLIPLLFFINHHEIVCPQLQNRSARVQDGRRGPALSVYPRQTGENPPFYIGLIPSRSRLDILIGSNYARKQVQEYQWPAVDNNLCRKYAIEIRNFQTAVQVIDTLLRLQAFSKSPQPLWGLSKSACLVNSPAAQHRREAIRLVVGELFYHICSKEALKLVQAKLRH